MRPLLARAVVSVQKGSFERLIDIRIGCRADDVNLHCRSGPATFTGAIASDRQEGAQTRITPFAISSSLAP